MPSRKKHVKLIRLVLGEDIANKYEFVHKIKDYPAKFLGKKHRKLYHDFDTFLYFFFRDPIAGLVSVVHDFHDYFDSLYNYMERRMHGKRSRAV